MFGKELFQGLRKPRFRFERLVGKDVSCVKVGRADVGMSGGGARCGRGRWVRVCVFWLARMRQMHDMHQTAHMHRL